MKDNQIIDFMVRAAEQTGFQRERYVDENLPTTWSNVVILPFFGDVASTAMLSSLILPGLLKKLYPSKYVIVCSWVGFAGLFPYADEYWSIVDRSVNEELADKALRFRNSSEQLLTYTRNLRRYFETVLNEEDITRYWQNGLTPEYFNDIGAITRFLPSLPSPKTDVTKVLYQKAGFKVLVYPCRMGGAWRRQESLFKLSPAFWTDFVNLLLEEGFTPVVYQNHATYDISPTFGDSCVYVTDRNIMTVLAAMRVTGCVLDVMSGISRLAIMARCPFVMVDERQRYLNLRDFEMNDLVATGLPCHYIFYFSTIIESGLTAELSDNVIAILNKFIPTVDRDTLPTTVESYAEVSYEAVRKHKARRLGRRFIKVERFVI